MRWQETVPCCLWKAEGSDGAWTVTVHPREHSSRNFWLFHDVRGACGGYETLRDAQRSAELKEDEDQP